MRTISVRLVLSARVPVTSVCPCSKAISDYGAHNQRGHMTIDMPGTRRRRAGCPSLGRGSDRDRRGCRVEPGVPAPQAADERHVTMLGYDHPSSSRTWSAALPRRFALA